MTTYVFPGQGAQYPGMGGDLFDEFPSYARAADDVLGYSLRDVCAGTGGRLNDTRFAQPALYVVHVLEYLRLQRLSPAPAAYLLGHSLGEYCALHAAGAFDFETGLRLVQRRGALMATAEDGAMAAVLGLGIDDVERALAERGAADLWIANDNAPDQVVVSGAKRAVAAARDAFLARGATSYVPLPVSGAFHSPLMRAAQAAFRADLDAAPLRPLRARVVANVTAAFYDDASVRDRLCEQVSGRVRWVESVRRLAARGETRFIEVGKRRPLTGAIEKILAAAAVTAARAA